MKLHKKILIVCLTLLGLIVLFWPEISFAQGAEDKAFKEELSKLVTSLQLLLQALTAVLWPILAMIGGLMDNELIFGGEMGEKILDIWVQMRNIVNVIFVLLLIIIAVYNVLGFGEEGGPFSFLSLKQSFRKFIIALILVNFSFLGMKLFLDFTNVLTSAVFALPGSPAEFQKEKTEIEALICSVPSDEMPLQKLFCENQKFNAKAEQFFSRFSGQNAPLVYAIQFGKLPTLKFVRDDLRNMFQLTFNILFDLAITLVYAFSFIALFVVLAARLIVLWIAVALSPLIALTLVIPELKNLLGGEGADLKEKFLKNAIAPLNIGFVLSIGFIMLRAFDTDAGIKSGYFSSVTLTDLDPNALPTSIHDLQELMIAIGMVAVIWIAVFSAAKGTVAEGMVNSIKGFGESIGKFVGTLPGYIPFIPFKGKGRVSPMQLVGESGLFQTAKRKFQMEHGTWPGPERDAMRLRNAIPNREEFARSAHENPAAIRYKPDILRDYLIQHEPKKDKKEEIQKLSGLDALLQYIRNNPGGEGIRELLRGKTADEFAEMVRVAELPQEITMNLSTPEGLSDALKGYGKNVKPIEGELAKSGIGISPTAFATMATHLANFSDEERKQIIVYAWTGDAKIAERIDETITTMKKIKTDIEEGTQFTNLKNSLSDSKFPGAIIRQALKDSGKLAKDVKWPEELKSDPRISSLIAN